MTNNQDSALTRRTVLTGAAAIGVTSALAACGDSGSSGNPGSGPVTVSAADVPVGGGKILASERVVVTQPTAGNFKAFSAACTHQGCVVARVEKSQITCTCHGSVFSAADGSVVNGPATRALTGKTVNVSGDTITVT